MARRLMHAVQHDGYGGGAAGLKHVEVPVPTPKKDEVLLKLEATSLNPIDWKIQQGVLRPFLPRRFPHIPGGVGHYAVQLAKLGNTHVTATCGARNIELVKSLGADEVLDYKTPEGAALKSPSGRKYDAVIHCATGIPWSTFEPNLSENGNVIDITPSPNAMITCALKKLTFSKKQLVPLVWANIDKESMYYLVKLVKEGKLKTIIDSKHPLSKAEDAWAKSIDGHATGKVIVEN
ncbi:hypothetical protein JCGZ_15151 [Jatropha curcas]|uniref:Enoyl reductase (ER) domain-containing protein n=1 Tax=Jatropha curcas TaxID=180498 RepID=A0A067LA10_JATCU|nr:hypothetical protein JCGZ_15151 [Jatropha curcas]